LLIRERPAVVEVVAWAAGNGDRSENADYQYGLSPFFFVISARASWMWSFAHFSQRPREMGHPQKTREMGHPSFL